MSLLLRIALGFLTGIPGTIVIALLALSLSYNIGALKLGISFRPLGSLDWQTAFDIDASRTATALVVTAVACLLLGITAGVVAGKWINRPGARRYAAILLSGSIAASVIYLCVDIDDSALLETSRRFRTRELRNIDREWLYKGFRLTPGAGTSEIGSIIGKDSDPIGDDKWIKENADSIQQRWEECETAREWAKFISDLQPYESQCTDISSPIVDFEVVRSLSKACIRHASLLIANGSVQEGIDELSDLARFGQSLQRGGGFLVDVMIGVVVEKMAFENILRVAESGAIVRNWDRLDRALTWNDANRKQAILDAYQCETAVFVHIFDTMDRDSRGLVYLPIRLVWNPGATMKRLSDLMTRTARAIVENDQLELECLEGFEVHEGLPSHIAFKNMAGVLTAEAAIPSGSKKMAASLKALNILCQRLNNLRAQAMSDATDPAA